MRIKVMIIISLLAMMLVSCGKAAPEEPGANETSTVTEQTQAANETPAANETSATPEPTAPADPLADYPVPDLSGYTALANYDAPLCFVDMTVRDAVELIDAGESFVFFASFADCPWCNAAIAHLNDVALEYDAKIGLLDTRKDPSWMSNTDIDDYELFVEYFGAYLEDDEEGKPHLYTPHAFFIRDGEIVYEHQGALPEMGDDPLMQLTDAQIEAFKEIYRAGFEAMKK